MEHVQFDREKFLCAVHYICARCEPRELGKVKLHKALYFADMLHFLHTGRPLTGVEYQKQQFGPVARHLGWATGELAKRNLLKVDSRLHYGFPKTDFISLVEPDTSCLSEDATAIIDDVLEFVRGVSAREISELSHNEVWQKTDVGEAIPYFTAFGLVPTEVTDEDVAWGEAEARELLG